MITRTLAAPALLLAAVSGTAAYAQDDTPTFTGPRVEATAGWQQVDFDLARYSIAGTSKGSGVGWGVAAGYDVPLGANVVAGVETGVSFSNVDHSFTDGTATYLMHARRDIDVSARLGVILGRALLYGKAGYTNFQLGSDTTDAAGVTTAQRANLDGVRVGAGVELGLSKAAYVKTEYRYSNYEQGVSKNDVLAGIGIRF